MLLQNQVIFAAALFFFKEGNPGSAEHQHFPVQAKRIHAESVFFEYGKQTCSGSPLYICFVQINYARKQQTGQPFVSCPVLFLGLMQQPLVFGAEAAVSRCLSAPNDRACRYGYAALMLLRSTRSASSESTHPSPLKSIMSSLPSASNPSAYLIISKASYVVISPSWFTSPIIQ